MTKQVTSLSLDLDNKWSYLKTHGNDVWESFPSYLPLVVPRILDYLDERNLTITFFIVGKDATIAENRAVLRSIADAGHEIGNHSFMHEPWLHLYSRDQLVDDLGRAHGALRETTGFEPVGFRGPGYSMSEDTLDVLRSFNYEYDATMLPNILNPVGRFYYFMKSGMSREERKQRKALFGTWRDALRPVTPYRWDLDGDDLLEIPVTTMPGLKVPIHFSYLLYLAGFSKAAAKAYFRTALEVCKAAGTQPSLLLHPLDFLGPEDDDDLAFFPGMGLPLPDKLSMVTDFLDMLEDRYSLVPLRDHAASLSADLPRRVPDFAHLAAAS